MDSLIHGYSNFTFTAPTTTNRVTQQVSSPAIFDETDTRFKPAPAPVLITPTMETVKPTYVTEKPTFTPLYEEQKTFNPIIDAIDSKPVYVKPSVKPVYEEQTPVFIDSKSISEKDEDRNIKTITPIVVVPNTYVAPPLIVSGGGGGGGAMGQPSTPKLSSVVVDKPSFLKKNFIPLLLVATAIYVFIKKPIK